MVALNILLTKALDYIDQERVAIKKLHKAHDVLSNAYRQKKGTSSLTTSEHIKAYFTARMPATFASMGPLRTGFRIEKRDKKIAYFQKVF